MYSLSPPLVMSILVVYSLKKIRRYAVLYCGAVRFCGNLEKKGPRSLFFCFC